MCYLTYSQRIKQNRHFTLVELLVVIAIISILAGLLLPTLQTARNSALTTTCLSNMRQQGVVIQLYSGESDDFLPGRFWLREVVPYVNANIIIDTVQKEAIQSGAGIFLCPSEIYPAKDSSNNLVQCNYTISGIFGAYPTAIASNTRIFFAYSDNTDPVSRAYHAKAAQVIANSQKVFIAEEGLYRQGIANSPITTFAYGYALNNARLGRPHQTQGNILRTDIGAATLEIPSQYFITYPYYASDSWPGVNHFTVNLNPTSSL